MSSSHVTHDQGNGGPVIASCSSGGHGMDYDQDKVDEMVLALLWLTQTGGWRTLE